MREGDEPPFLLPVSNSLKLHLIEGTLTAKITSGTAKNCSGVVKQLTNCLIVTMGRRTTYILLNYY